MVEKFENIVVGTGISGLVCGGYLAKGGQKTLLLDKDKVVGGRWHHLPMGNFTVVMHLPLIMSSLEGGFWAVAAKDLGADIRQRYSKEPRVFIDGDNSCMIDIPRIMSIPGVTDWSMDYLQALYTEKLPADLRPELFKLWNEILSKPFLEMAEEYAELSLKDYFEPRTSNPYVRRLFSSLSASMCFMGSADLSWEYASAGKTFVMIRAWVAGEGSTVAPHPNLIEGIAQPFARAIEALGGEIRLQYVVEEVIVEEGKAVGVRVTGLDGEKIIYADRVIVTASWLQVEKLFKEVPTDIQKALAKPKTIHRAGAFLVSLLDKTVSHEPGFVLVTDAKTGDNIGGIFNQSEELPWCSPAGKQLIWMYYLDDLEEIKKKDLDDLVANKLNPILDKVYPGFLDTPKWQKFFYSEAGSHNGLSGGPKISAKSPDIENLYFAGDGTKPNYAAISDGAASTGMAVAKMILGLDKLGIL